MIPDQFTPPPHPPVIHEVRVATADRAPIRVTSHGYLYLVRGNTLLPPEKIRAVLLEADNPNAAVAALNASYHRAGYFLVAIKATLQGKTVPIEIIQGRITEQQSTGAVGSFFSGLKNRDDLRESDLVRRAILADAFAHRNGEQLHVQFGPAPQPGGSSMTLQTMPIKDYFPLSGNLLFGNFGSRYSSRYLTGGSLSYDPGWGTNISINAIQGLSGLDKDSQGSQYTQGQLSVSSITPWGIYGFTSQWTHYRIGQVAFPLNPTGNIFSWSLTGNQLLYANATTRLSVNEAYTHTSNVVKVYQSILPGGYLLTDQRYGYFSLGAQGSRAYTLLDRPGSVSANFTYNQGISAERGTLYADVPGAPTSHFHYFTSNISLTQTLPAGMNLSFTASGQGAFNTLPQNQQWVLGGFGNLSAFYPGVLVGDSGYSARLQLQGPAWQWQGFAVRLNFFTETGGSTYTYLSPRQTPWQSLSDVGGGVALTSPWGTQIQALSAVPVGWNHVTSAQRKASRVDFYFVLTQNF